MKVLYSANNKPSMFEYAPHISIVDYKTGFFIAQQGEGECSPGDELCFFTEDSYNAYTSGEACDCITLTIRLKDSNLDTPNYSWFCSDFAQLISTDDDVNYDFVMPIYPTYIVPVKADKDGNVLITLFFICKKTDDSSADGIASLVRNTAAALIVSDLHIRNEFAEEQFTIIGDVDFSKIDSDANEYIPATSWEMENPQRDFI